MSKLTLFGAHLSPYVRKTRLVLAFKSLEYKHIPVVPFGADQPKEFVENSPLGKIPLLKTGADYISDSSAICAYLEREYKDAPLLPSDNVLAARALWFEEYADSYMTSVIGGHLFAERVLASAVFKRDPVQADIDLAIQTEIPAIFDYLTGELNGDFLVGDALSIADLAVCGLFVAMKHCDVECDADKWPALSAYIERILSLPFVQKMMQEEKHILKQFFGVG